ncbi:TPA: DUF1073 domain-containing protein [Campylobacter jejuni]|nr:DUF1073 domain-containing protein [Campylobacter jejuni]
MKKKFYPSKRKIEDKKIINNVLSLNQALNNSYEIKQPDLSKPFKFNDETCDKIFNQWCLKFKDEWHNNVASVNSNNSLSQYNNFIINRLSYSECAYLSSDAIINNAITKYCNEILRKGGKINLDLEDDYKSYETELKEYIEKRLKKIKFFEVLREAISTSLIYGGALIFLDINADDLSSELSLTSEHLTLNKLKGLRVVPPYLCGASEVETANPLSYDFMEPTLWNVSGNKGLINSSRFLKLVMFEAPVLIKPLYNYFGISLCQFMKNYVASADIARQSLSDIFLRFRTDIIQSNLIKTNPQEAVSRAKAINQTRNNLSLLLLTEDENFIQSITSLSGLDKIVAQLQENVAVSARMPAVKLLGLTPSGFNATGEFDLNSYYDEIMSLQNTIIKPLIEKVLHILCLEKGIKTYPEYEFEVLTKTTKLEQAQINNLEADFVGKNITAGVLTQEQAFEYLQKKELIDNNLDFEENEEDFNLGNEIDYGENKEYFKTNQTDYTEKY